MNATHVETFIIGAGFAGMGAALYLTEQNSSVALCEMLKYPGGCAGTFHKGEFAFEAGATLFSGFHERGLFRKWVDKYELPVQFQPLDPIIEFRTEDWYVPISPNRQITIDRFCELPGAPVDNIRRFFKLQKQISDTLWPMFEDASRIPPFTFGGLNWHIKRCLMYPKLWSVMNRNLWSILETFELSEFKPIVQYCNAVCQITIQTNARNAEALFALSAMDYLFRGTGHINNGIGKLSFSLVDAIRQNGGDVTLSNKVKKLQWLNNQWHIETRNGNYTADRILANLIPPSIAKLVDNLPAPPEIEQYTTKLADGWGAGMLYLILKDHEALPEQPHHYQCVAKDATKYQEGHHIFCSLSGRNETEKHPEGYRTATVSTHIPMRTQLSLKERSSKAQYTQKVQDQMRKTLQDQLPEVYKSIEKEYPGSPRTFQRFTGREQGFVGGLPRTQGWHNYSGLIPKPLYPKLWMIGDTGFPGQSTLATALGGIRVARWAT